MPAPTLQFKRGLLANLPGLKAGEPGFTTDFFELYVGIDSTTTNNKFFGSHRYWTKGTTSTGSGVNFVEGTSNGTDYITIKAPNSLSGITTFTLPGADGINGQVLSTNGSGTLSFTTLAESSFTISNGIGSTDTVGLGQTLTFAGTANEIETAVTDNQVQIGLPGAVSITTSVVVGSGVTINISGINAAAGIVTAVRFVSNVLDGTAPISVASSTQVTNLNAQYVGGFGAPVSPVIGATDAQTLTNKTIALGSNTISGTLAEFNTALTDADFVSISGTETLSNKTLLAGTATPTGTASQPLQVNGGAFVSGTLGIGTTNPDQIFKLVVNGAANFIGSVTSSEGFFVNGNLVGGSISGTNIAGTSLNITGISTLQSTTLIGGGTSTGTAGQVLQVTGISSGVYIGGNLGVGVTNPQTRLEISGVLGFTGSNNIKIGNVSTGSSLSYGSGENNFFAGQGAGQFTTNGSNNNFVGSGAGSTNTTGSDNNILGYQAGQFNTSGFSNNFFGSYAGNFNTTGFGNNFIGATAGSNNGDGRYNNFLGGSAGFNNTGTYNIFIGQDSGSANRTGNNNIYLGSSSGISTSASFKVIIGSGLDYSTYFDSPSTTKDAQFAVGVRTDYNPSKYWLVGDENFNIGIGTTNPTSKLQVQGNVLVSGVVTATTYYGDISNTVSGRWILGASGTSDYTFTGIGFTQTTNDPTLYLKRGEVYEFVNNSGGSHPFQIRVSNGGAAYNNGVTNNGASSGTIIFQVPYNAPNSLYYQCTNHSSMGGDIVILGGGGIWARNSSSFEYSEPNKFKGVIETVSAATTYNSAAGSLVLELDVRQATTYTYTIPTGANIGIVSFKNMSAPTGSANGTTITCIFTQNAAGTGNTTGTTGIGTNCTVIGYENGAAVAGISTRALVGSGTTVSLSATANDRDFVSFFIHYTGDTNTTASSYQVYVTKNGGFRQGNVGV
jgi:hypothetical protein